jgi:hypothetical protein
MVVRASIWIAIAVVGLVAVAGVAAGAPRDWVGSAACGSCHPAELAAWQITPHARTGARFAVRPGARCLSCHSTGEAPAGPAIAVEVGCEACHGAGAAYAEVDIMRNRPVSLALGLVDLSTRAARAAVCAQCHRTSTRAQAFDPTAPVHPTSLTPPSRTPTPPSQTPPSR